MKLTILFLLFFSLTLFFFVPSVFAADVSVTGNIDNGGAQVPGSKIVFKDTVTQKVVATKEIDILGNYAVFVPQGTYDISVIPPAQSGAKQVTKRNQQITTDTQSSFVLSSSPKPQMKKTGDNTVSIIVTFMLMLLVSGGTFYIWKKNK